MCSLWNCGAQFSVLDQYSLFTTHGKYTLFAVTPLRSVKVKRGRNTCSLTPSYTAPCSYIRVCTLVRGWTAWVSFFSFSLLVWIFRWNRKDFCSPKGWKGTFGVAACFYRFQSLYINILGLRKPAHTRTILSLPFAVYPLTHYLPLGNLFIFLKYTHVCMYVFGCILLWVKNRRSLINITYEMAYCLI